ncbi:hypothetical protein ACSBR1_008924 [Camellia fascicularis]
MAMIWGLGVDGAVRVGTHVENSQVANARFQAAAAIRDAAIREWVFLTADEKTSLISFCLCFVMQHASSPKGYVQAKVSPVAAQLMKRGWLDFTTAENEVFLYHVSLLSFKNASAMYYFFDIIAWY